MTTDDLRFRVTRWGTRWTVEDALNPHAKQPIYNTELEAQNEADRRNQLEHRPRPARPTQPDLFSSQEATS